MGSGKSTTGKWLAERLDHEYIDLDDYVEKMTGLSVSTIFSSQGEKVFRELEKKALIEVTRKSRIVIATGGGIPSFSDNMDLMNRSGKTVYIKVSLENLFKRLVKEKDHRPLIRGKSESELKRYIKDKLEEREIFYRKAQFVIKGDLLDQEDLVTLLN